MAGASRATRIARIAYISVFMAAMFMFSGAAFARTGGPSCSSYFARATGPRPQLTYDEATSIANNAQASHPMPQMATPAFVQAAITNALNSVDGERVFALKAEREAVEGLARAMNPALLAELYLRERVGRGPLHAFFASVSARMESFATWLSTDSGVMARVIAAAKAAPAQRSLVERLSRRQDEDESEPSEASSPETTDQVRDKFIASLGRHARVYLDQGFGDDETARFVLRIRRRQIEQMRSWLSTESRPTLLLAALIGALDAHSSYSPPAAAEQRQRGLQAGFTGIGIMLNETPRGIEIRQVIRDSGASEAGIRPGDQITLVNGVSVSGRTLEDVMPQVVGEPGTRVELGLIRDGRSIVVSAERRVLPTAPRTFSQTFSVLKSGGREIRLGSIRLSVFGHGTGDEVAQAIVGMRDSVDGLVLDLRGNGGGSLDEAIKILSAFVSDGPVLGMSGDRPQIAVVENPLAFDKPVVVLVDGGSASASELVAGALQARGRAIVAGTRTFGKGTYQSMIPMRGPAGGLLGLTQGYFFGPNGVSPQGTGVVPDVEIARMARRLTRESDLPRAMPPARADGPFISLSPIELAARARLIERLRAQAGARRFSEGPEPIPLNGLTETQDSALNSTLEVLADLVDAAH